MASVTNSRWADVAFPWGPALKQVVDPKGDIDVLKTSIINILMTRPRERVMRPEFGSGIPDQIFEPNDDVLQATLGTAINEAVRRWDDRIELTKFEADREDNTITVKITFRNTKDPLKESVSTIGFSFSETEVSIFGI